METTTNQGDIPEEHQSELRTSKVNREFVFRYIVFGLFVLFVFTPTLIMPRKWLYSFFFPLFNRGYLWAAKIKVKNLSDRQTFKESKPVIYAPIHKCYADSIILGLFLRHPFTVLMDMVNRNNNIFFRFIAWKMGLIPMDRDFASLMSKKNSLERCIEVIAAEKYSLIMSPEGRHYYDQIIGPLKKGIIRIARETNSSIIPVAIHNITGHFVFEEKLRWKQCYIKFGTPFSVNDFAGDREALVHLKSEMVRLYNEIDQTVNQGI